MRPSLTNLGTIPDRALGRLRAFPDFRPDPGGAQAAAYQCLHRNRKRVPAADTIAPPFDTVAIDPTCAANRSMFMTTQQLSHGCVCDVYRDSADGCEPMECACASAYAAHRQDRLTCVHAGGARHVYADARAPSHRGCADVHGALPDEAIGQRPSELLRPPVES